MANTKEERNTENNSESNFQNENLLTDISEDLNMNKRAELWRWRFKEGGHRLPLFASQIPHLNDYNYPNSCVLKDTYENLKLCKEIAQNAKNMQAKLIYAKQQADLLQQERDLLKWHNSNNHKALKLKKEEFNIIRDKIAALQRKIEQTEKTIGRIENEKKFVIADMAKENTEIEELQTEKEATHVEFEEMLGRRNDFVIETTAERRMAARERKRRWEQYNKLRLVVNKDRKTHTKLDTWSRLDDFTLSQYTSVKNYLNSDFQNINDIMLQKQTLET